MSVLNIPPLPQISRQPGEPLDLSVLRVIERMQSDPSVVVPTERLAAALGVAPSIMIRAFTKRTGLSPQRFRAALRIARAKELVVETDRSITEISLDVGYSSLGSFVRIFTMLTGVCPSHLRRLARSKTLQASFDAAVAAPTEFSPPSAGISGQIVEMSETANILIVGLFERGLPAGIPLDGQFVDPSDARFALEWSGTSRRSCLLAASVNTLTWSDAWVGRYPGMRVARVELRQGDLGPLYIKLRSTLPTDPPFLTPLPLLQMIQHSRRYS